MTAGEAPVALVVFTRDLRVLDNPALVAAARGGRVVCAFVRDAAIVRGRPFDARRDAFLTECLSDLDAALGRLGTRLVVRAGEWVDEVVHLAAEAGARAVHLSDDVTPYARRRFARLEAAAGTRLEIRRHPGLSVVPPGAVLPAGGDHYHVFTPYHRRWLAAPRRPVLAAPRLRDGGGDLPGLPVPPGPRPAGTDHGGERAARARLDAWLRDALPDYARRRDALERPGGARLSAALHFGCLSPLAVVEAAARRPGADGFVRQLCWRDFYLQVLSARPDAAWDDYVARPGAPRRDPGVLAAWREGRTGVPIVDAAMRQLTAEGLVPNRARMVVASYLTKTLGQDWRCGARHFLDHLLDADLAVNNLNWQWTAGHGTGSHPKRVLSPTRQARRFDPGGDYVRRHVPELAALDASVIHEPWRLGAAALARLGYPLAQDGLMAVQP